MSADTSSSSPEVVDESTQTKDSQILDQNVKTGDSEIASGDHDKSSSPESNQTTTSDPNNLLAPEFEPKTDKSTEVSTTQIQNSVSDSAATTTASGNQQDSPPSTAPATSTTQTLDSDANKQATLVQPTVAPETSTTQTPDSDSNKHVTTIPAHAPGTLSPTEGKPIAAPATSTTQIPDSDANKQTTTIPAHAPGTLSPTEGQPIVAPETSAPQIPDSDADKHATTIPAHAPMALSPTEGQPIVAPATSTTQIPDSDANKQPTTILAHAPGTLSPTEGQPIVAPATSTTQIPDSDANKQANTIPAHAPGTLSPTEGKPIAAPATSTTQIPDSDANKQTTTIPAHAPGTLSPTEGQPIVAPETSAPQIPDSDADKHATTIPAHAPMALSPTEGQPIVAPATSTTQIPDSYANKQPTTILAHAPGTLSPTEGQPIVTPATSTTQIPDSDANKQANTIPAHASGTLSPTEGQPIVAPATSTTQIPDSDVNKHVNAIPAHAPGTSSPTEGQPLVAPETSTPQIPDSDANKHELGNTSPPKVSPTTKVAAPNQESTSITQTYPPKISSPEIQHTTDPPPGITPTDLPAPEQKPNNETAPSDSTPEQERKHLMNLIDQELKFVEKVCPKLGKHQEHIKKEAKDATNAFGKLKNEPCELKELKDLKKIVTKLKLQIPAKYRTYDEIDPQENKQFDMDNRGGIPAKLLKKMPQLHDQLYRDSPFSKTIQKRYNDLRRELKLCLLCFSVFPENAIISRRLMVYWWIGEGLVPVDDDERFEKTTEDRANRCFEELIEEDFIQPVSKSHGRNVATCKMHPMVRASLVMIADKVKFFDFDEYGNPKDFGKFDEIESPEDVPLIYPLGEPREFFDFYDENHEETYESVRFHDSGGNPIPFAPYHPDNFDHPVDRNGKPIDSKKKFYFYEKKKITTKSYKVCLMGSGLSKGIPWEKLHMLFNVKDDILEFKPEWFLRMKNVNVVFLGRWQSSAAHHIEVEEFKFKESLEHMNNVRFFSLQGVSRISELPKSISNLESLLILDLRACHNLEIIPKTIGLLKCLTHLDMSECYLLENMPKEISSLESLEVLKGFVVVESPGRHICTLNDLRKLGNLRKLSMYTHMKDFPQESHLDALQKFERLRKLSILWGGHESKNKTDKLKKDVGCQSNLASKMMKLIPRKQWVKGSMRRMNAFNNSTLGSRLEKLDLKCFPDHVTPNWLTPGSLKGLKKLYIRGGQFSDLGQYQDVYEWETSPIPAKDTWNVEVLRLKYLDELKMDWRELQDLFPKMNSLEKVKCPRLTLFPCNEHGVWTKKPTTATR